MPLPSHITNQKVFTSPVEQQGLFNIGWSEVAINHGLSVYAVSGFCGANA